MYNSRIIDLFSELYMGLAIKYFSKSIQQIIGYSNENVPEISNKHCIKAAHSGEQNKLPWNLLKQYNFQTLINFTKTIVIHLVTIVELYHNQILTLSTNSNTVLMYNFKCIDLLNSMYRYLQTLIKFDH